jgi:hypothetical protein
MARRIEKSDRKADKEFACVGRVHYGKVVGLEGWDHDCGTWGSGVRLRIFAVAAGALAGGQWAGPRRNRMRRPPAMTTATSPLDPHRCRPLCGDARWQHAAPAVRHR